MSHKEWIQELLGSRGQRPIIDRVNRSTRKCFYVGIHLSGFLLTMSSAISDRTLADIHHDATELGAVSFTLTQLRVGSSSGSSPTTSSGTKRPIAPLE